MKFVIIALLLLAAVSNSFAQNPPNPSPGPAKDLYHFGWPDWFRELPHPAKMEITPQISELSLVYWGEGPADLEVQRVEVNVLSTLEFSQFAIEGWVRYSKVTPGSCLEMWCYFAPEKKGDPQTAYVVRTLDDSGPIAKLDGESSDFRRFQIPFDTTGAKTHLERVIFKLHLAGGYGTTLQFYGVRFMEYPNGYFPSSVASPGTLSPASIPPTPKSPIAVIAAAPSVLDYPDARDRALKIRWFWIGVGATTSVLFILAGCAVIFHELRKKSNERELRRIASLDS